KDYMEVEKVRVRTAYGVLASCVGIITNVILFFSKLLIGILVNSISITADAFNNLSDAASSIVAFIGVKMAERPADKEHPFGHGRLEYIAALIVSFLILMVGFTLMSNSFQKVIRPESLDFSLMGLIILFISVLLKLWLSAFNKKLGLRINSGVLKATAADARNDVLVTLTTMVSMIVSYFTGLKIDGWIGLVVSAFVLFAGYHIAKDTLLPLLGEAIDPKIYDKICKKVESYEGILGSHDLILHNYGPSNTMATIHAEVPKNSKLGEIHEIIDRIEREVLEEMGISLVIHMDPVDIDDIATMKLRRMVEMIVGIAEPLAHIHDFRIVHQEERTKMVFDVVVPHT
ncbi:MAG: cation transporter, partial [Vallitaleaceae bacterium]|nr:cation transporter [Vallitaleaceae bacterium]